MFFDYLFVVLWYQLNNSNNLTQIKLCSLGEVDQFQQAQTLKFHNNRLKIYATIK